MSPLDFASLAEMESQIFSDPWSEAVFESEYYNETACYILAFLNGSLAGYGGFHLLLEEVEIERIAVSKEYRKMGIGTQILQEILVRATNSNAERVFLEVRESNLPARRLYLKQGFREISMRKNYYSNNENAVIMKYEI